MFCFTLDNIKIDCDIYNIEQEPTQANNRTIEHKRRQSKTMNGVINQDGGFYYHNVKNADFSGVFADDYHFFIKYGDKVYMEVKGVGEVVISFDELQKNKQWKHWKQYYDLSLLLTNDTHDVVYDSIYSSKNTKYSDTYSDARFWSIHTSFIDAETKVITEGYACHYKINPYDLVYMEYTSQEDLDTFDSMYMNTRGEFIDRELEIYNELAATIESF